MSDTPAFRIHANLKSVSANGESRQGTSNCGGEDSEAQLRYTELFRRLFISGRRRMVSFISGESDDTVSKVLTALASQMAEAGFPTIVVNEQLGLVSIHGDQIAAELDCVEKLEQLRFVEGCAAVQEVFAALRQGPFWVLANCGSIRSAAALLLIAPETDGVVFIASSGKTSIEELSRAVRLVEEAHSHLLGCILEGRRYTLPTFIYKRVFR